MEAAKQFGRNLRTARRQAGLTQDRLAAEVYLHHSAISRIETGKYIPRLDHVIRLAAALELRVRDLLFGIE
jgi:transcriptional regulator with XRE-family HTH domain